MALVTPISFSQDDQFMAYSTPDGTLQYWDIKNNKLRKTIKSSTHLTATCTCLKWGIKNDVNVSINFFIIFQILDSKFNIIYYIILFKYLQYLNN